MLITTSRASFGPTDARAAAAICWHWARSCSARAYARPAPCSAPSTGSSRRARPAPAPAAGRRPASPHTPTGLPAACARRRTAAATRSSTAGCHGSSSSASAPCHPVGGHRVLGQVVGADDSEVDLREQSVGAQRGGRAPRSSPRPSAAPCARTRRGEPAASSARRDHRRHHPDVGAGRLGGRGDRLELVVQQLGPRRPQPQAADAERRVLLLGRGRRTPAACRRRRPGCGHHLAVAERLRTPRGRSRPAPRRSAPSSRSRNSNSVRNSPTPSSVLAPAALRRPAAVPMLASSATAWPSAGLPWPAAASAFSAAAPCAPADSCLLAIVGSRW